MANFTFYQNVWLFLSLLSNFILSVLLWLNQVILVFSYVLFFFSSQPVLYWLRYLSCKCIYWCFSFSIQDWHCLLTIRFQLMYIYCVDCFLIYLYYLLFLFVPLLGFYFLSFHDFPLITIAFKISLLYSIPIPPTPFHCDRNFMLISISGFTVEIWIWRQFFRYSSVS